MTLISTGSTLMPVFSSHWMAALMSGRWPSSSRQTIPISSVTLAWRTFVMTGNFCVSCQITGLVMSFGGYISHRRDFCGPGDAALEGVGFFAAGDGAPALPLGAAIMFIRRRLRE